MVDNNNIKTMNIDVYRIFLTSLRVKYNILYYTFSINLIIIISRNYLGAIRKDEFTINMKEYKTKYWRASSFIIINICNS
jgi:hypothetical protein